jgi:anti-sigma B factor antagonist
VLDLHQVQALDAAGIGLLVDLHCRAQQRERSVTVSNPSPRVRRLLSLTSLDSLLQFSDLDALELALTGERAMSA